MSHVVLFAQPIKLNTSTTTIVIKILLKQLYHDFKWSLQCNELNEILDKPSCHRNFKYEFLNDYIFLKDEDNLSGTKYTVFNLCSALCTLIRQN